MPKFLLLLYLLLCFYGLSVSAQESTLGTDERNMLIYQALSFYYNGKPTQARAIAEVLKQNFPEDAFFRELTAEIIWLELSQKSAPQRHLSEDVNYGLVQRNIYLVEQFKEEIFTGLVLTQIDLKKNPSDSRAVFLRGMLKARYGGFIAKFESGLKSYAEADRETAEGLELIKKAVGLDPSLCSANYIIGLTKYMLFVKMSDSLINNIIIRWKSSTYDAIGRRLDMGEIFTILRDSMRCRADYYYAKDVEIDKKLIFQDVFVKQAGKMDDEVLPVLEELNARFPENEKIRDNLFLVKLHIKNKQ